MKMSLTAQFKKRISDWLNPRFESLMPIVILALCVAAYGIMSLWQSFYWDDWPKLLFAESIGSEAFRNFAAHRPLNGLWYILSLSILGTSPLRWQLYIIFWRWASALAFWWSLKKLWPKKTKQAAMAALLFVIYPGFSQTNIALSYYVHFLAYTTFFLSLGFTLWAVRSTSKSALLHILAYILLLLTMLTTDYYYGLELIRPILIFIALGHLQDLRQRTWQTAKLASAYLLIVGAFFIWRSTVDTGQSYQISFFEQFGTGGPSSVTHFVGMMLGDLWEGGIIAWVQAVGLFAKIDWASRVSQFGLVWLILITFAVFAYLSHAASERRKFGRSEKEAIFLGISALTLANLPAWSAGLEISLNFPADRLTLPMAAGAALLLVGFIPLLMKSRKAEIMFVAVLIGLSAGLHFERANAFRLDGERHSVFWQQFVWRVPDLVAGSSVLSQELPLAFFTDDSLTGAMNLIFPSENPNKELSNALLYLDLRLGSKIPSLEEGEAIDWSYRLIDFTGSTSQALVIFFAPPGCLRVLSPEYDAQYPFLPAQLRAALPLSKPELIVANEGIPGQLPDFTRTTSQDDSWCYFFEKADLARQEGNWAEVSRLGDIAFQLDDSPNHASERVPFIEGYARTGRWARAIELSLEAYAINEHMQPMLCATWRRIENSLSSSPDKVNALEIIEESLVCN